MQLFIIFVIGAMIVGAGAMLSPAWTTQHPRIGLTAALCLAFVIGGTVFWAEAFGWNILVTDYLLFALVSGVVLGGTMSQGQQRAEAMGIEFNDNDTGWPGPQDLIFFVVIALLLIIPLLIMPVPLGRHGITAAYLATTTQLGQDLHHLAPFHTETVSLYPPGLQTISAYLSHQLHQPLSMIQGALGALVSFLIVWVAYDLGSEMIGDKRLGRAMAIASLVGFGLLGTYLTAQYSALMGILFSMAAILYTIRTLRHAHWLDYVGAGLMMGAVWIVNPILSILLTLSFVVWLILLAIMAIGNQNVSLVKVLKLFLIPGIALLATAPWLVSMWLGEFGLAPKLGNPSLQNLDALLVYHAILIALLALIGWLLSQRQDKLRYLSWWMAIWYLVVFDLACVGILGSLFPFIYQLADPRLIAWQGAIIPYLVLGGVALYSLWLKIAPAGRFGGQRVAYAAMGGIAVVILVVGLNMGGSLISTLQSTFGLEPVYASWDDTAVMDWVRKNLDEEESGEVRILNPALEGEWVTPLTLKDSLNFPIEPYYLPADQIVAEQEEWADYWTDPEQFDAAKLEKTGFTHVYVPEALADFSAPDYLELMYEQGKSRFYRVLTGESGG